MNSNIKYWLDNSESERLLYRKIKKEDYNYWLPFFQNPLTSQHWISEPESPEESCTKWYEKQFWRYHNMKGGMYAIVEKKSGRLVGHCGLVLQIVDEIEELEIAYSLLPQFWNHGYAAEAAAMCKELAFKNKLSDTLVSIISTHNIPSQKVAIKNGMQVEKTTFYNGNTVFIFRVTNPLIESTD